MRTDHWNKRALDFVRPHFDQARRQARIATGFFTVQGFDLVLRVLPPCPVYPYATPPISGRRQRIFCKTG